jgi:ligand-binding SRPBCC domain-containing protein
MPTIRLETIINAPPEKCFDLSLSVEVHTRSTSKTNERAVGGVTTGLLGLGDSVTWEAVHFGIKQHLTSRITKYDRPAMFVDEMVRGAFQSFTHKHEFRRVGDRTLMLDTFDYKSPLGPLGVLADRLFLERYMRKLLTERAQYIKQVAERDDPEQ